VYLLGKFARLALGTPNVDYNGRFCMAAAGKANMLAFGADRMMTPLDELRTAEVVVVIGAHISAAFPVAVPTLLNHVRKRGGTVIVVDPRAGRFVKKGDVHVALEPGTDSVFFNGVLREIIHQGLVDRDFVDNRTVGFTDAASAAMDYDPEFVELVADVPQHLLKTVASLIGSTTKCMFLHGRGPEQQTDGTQNVQSIINVGLACGHVGRPGAGINMLTGQRNGQGGREWGQRCDQLPAGRSITSGADRKLVASHWGVDEELLPGAGSSYVEILNGVDSGKTKGLLTICTNMAVSSPDLTAVQRQLGALEHHVVIDPFLSESARFADVILPGSSFAEESGTITTIEGRVVRIDQAVAPIAGRNDLDVIADLADGLHSPVSFRYDSEESIFEEMRAVSRGGPIDYSGISYERIRKEDGVFWPCPSPDHPGTRQLYQDRFAHLDGKARFHAVVPRQLPHETSPDFPLVLTTGRLLAQFLSGNQTRRIERQQRLAPEPYVEIHPSTAAAYQIEPGTKVLITSRQGSVWVQWRPHKGIRLDTLFMPYHWQECNTLVAADLDPISKIPGFKYTPVQIASPQPVDLRAESTTSQARSL